MTLGTIPRVPEAMDLLPGEFCDPDALEALDAEGDAEDDDFVPAYTVVTRPPAGLPDYDGTQLCRQVDPEEFFPESTPMQAVFGLCGDCHFLKPCRDYAVHYDVYGIWAGTSRSDRKRVRRYYGITPIPMYSTLHHTIERNTDSDDERDE